MKRELDRRAFLRGSGRWGLLGALTAATAVLVARGQTCSRAGACSGCGQLAGCALPPAEQYRRQPKGAAS